MRSCTMCGNNRLGISRLYDRGLTEAEILALTPIDCPQPEPSEPSSNVCEAVVCESAVECEETTASTVCNAKACGSTVTCA